MTIKTPTSRLPAVVILLGTALLCSSSPVASANAPTCKRADLEADLHSISSLVWLDDRSEIIVTDTAGEQVLSFHKTGALASEVPRKQQPFAISRIGDEYLQFIDEDNILWLDRQFKPLGAIGLSKGDRVPTKSESTLRILSIYDWTIAIDQLVGYGALEVPGSAEEFLMGFFAKKLTRPGTKGTPATPRFLVPLADGDPYLLGHPYHAAIGSVAYFLVIKKGELPQLARYDTSGEEGIAPTILNGYPTAEHGFPIIETQGRDLAAVYRSVEGAEMPVGLYSQDELLYVLMRSPGVDGTEWRLIQLKPGLEDVSVLGTMRIPSAAQHLAILPTPTDWIIFEKSGFDEQWHQRIPTLLVIPKLWVKDSTSSPLYQEAAAQVQCAHRQ